MQETWPEGSYSDTTAAHQDFANFFKAADSPPREGYWSPFTTLAWIVSRDDRFVAATQVFEKAYHSNRGAMFSETSWVVLGNEADQRFGRNFSQACEEDLRTALETGRLEGGIASPLTGGAPEVIARHQWTAWRRSTEIGGLMLIPEYVDFKWPSEAVRSIFPRDQSTSAVLGQDSKVAPIDPNAAPAINRDKGLADKCAAIMREGGGKLSTIMVKVLEKATPGEKANRTEESIQSAIRKAFAHYYDKMGNAKN